MKPVGVEILRLPHGAGLPLPAYKSVGAAGCDLPAGLPGDAPVVLAPGVIEDDFVSRCSSLAYALATLRNERGDISHGKAVPKTSSSNDRLSTLSMTMTESVLCYMLDAFYGIEPQATVEAGTEIQAEDEASDLPSYAYDKNSDFNDWLDERFPLEGRLIYSEALFQLFYEDYVIQLEAFREDGEG